ncbi:MAG: rhombosortase [Burkholderiaceae bacterium]|nr:rhombosortase [Burkholderiaceae bacterium]
MANAAPRDVPRVAAGVALACIGLALCPPAVNAWLAYDRQAILAGQVWRLWSAHLVHFSVQHALADALVFFLLAALAERQIGARRLGVCMALGAPLISAGLLLTAPNLAYYRGASGIAVTVAVLAGASLWRVQPARRGVLLLLAAIFLIKTACEAFGVASALANLPPDVVVAWQAHALGAAWGLLTAMSCRCPDSEAGERGMFNRSARF